MIESLRHAPLLQGWRGARPLDLDGCGRGAGGRRRRGAAHPELAELEVNPVLVHAEGAVALDAVATLR